MKKIIFSILTALFLGIALFLGYQYFQTLNNKKIEISTTKTETSTGQQEEVEELSVKKEVVEDRLAALKKKIKLKGLISAGNMYYSENEYMPAIIKYQKFLKEVPDDKEVNKKMGDIYYTLKNFKRANEYYEKVKDYPVLDKGKAIKSLVNARGVQASNIENLKVQIADYNPSAEEKFYYETALTCVLDYSLCRQMYEEYFEKSGNSGSEIPLGTDMKNIKKALLSFKNFKNDDLYYKAAFITGAFYENGFYYIALKKAEKLLSEKEGYKPMIKVAAKSAYEIGDYITAKKWLNQYKKIDSNDPEMMYFLARVYEELGENMLSYVHYEKAINDGYKNIAEIRRRKIFLYFETGDIEKMLREFKSLLNSNDTSLTQDDYNLGIYYHIVNGDIEKAKEYTKDAIKKFKDSDIFYGYLAWIMLQNENISPTEMNVVKLNIEKAKKISARTPMITMVSGIYELRQKKYNQAFILLKRARSLDKSGEYKDAIEYWTKKVREAKAENND